MQTGVLGEMLGVEIHAGQFGENVGSREVAAVRQNLDLGGDDWISASKLAHARGPGDLVDVRRQYEQLLDDWSIVVLI